MLKLSALQKFFFRYSDFIFILLLLSLCLFYHFDQILFLEPQSMHLWRQADCLSFTMNYFMEDRGFFEPSIHFIGKFSENGQTISDFPLFYFLIGKVWQITGQHEFIFRSAVLALFLTALFLIYRSLSNLFADKLWAMLPPIMLFTSPVLAYYSCNFLMNIPAFSFALIGWHFFYAYYLSHKQRKLILSIFFFTLAGLLKASALLSLGAIGGFWILEKFKWIQLPNRPVFNHKSKAFLLFVISGLVIISWISYVKYYNSNNNSDFFLVGILPIWEMSSSAILEKFYQIRTHWISLNFPDYFQLLVFISWILLLVRHRRVSRFFIYLNIVLALGVFSFLILFFQVIAGHDYYWIDLYIALFIIVVTTILYLKENHPNTFRHAKWIFAVILILNAFYCQKHINKRYHGEYMDYYNQYLSDFSSMKPVIRQLGISRDDLVISIPDGTINASLYLMDQKGWSCYGDNFETEAFFTERIQKGAKYLFVSDTTLLTKLYLQPFIRNKIAQHQSISVFSLEGLDQKRNYPDQKTTSE